MSPLAQLLPLLLLALACAPGERAVRPAAVAAAPVPADSGPVALSVLTYNVHGLKARYAKDDPERRLPEIGRLLNRYDVALLQEDFAYHDRIAATADHAIQRRGNRQDRNPIVDLLARIACGACGSGLSTFVGLEGAALVGERREAYEAYHGWFDSRYDAWVTKGFLVLRLRLPNGAVVDVYDTHLDAGKKPRRVKDRQTRGAQLEQLREAMERFSGGRAVVLGGDFNWRIDRPRPLLTEFAAAVGLREVGAEMVEPWRPRSDYIFYRSGDGVEIELRASGEATEFVDASGGKLSDHPAVFARFEVRKLPGKGAATARRPPAGATAPGPGDGVRLDGAGYAE